MSTMNNFFEVMSGIPYSVTTGYKIYADDATYGTGTTSSEGSGATVTMTFESAVTMAATATVAAAALLI